MPGFIARKLCPELVVVSPNYKKYQKVSEQVREVLAQYDPNFCPVGLDESYLDLTDLVMKRIMTADHIGTTCLESSCELPMSCWHCAEDVMQEIRDEICQKTAGLTASAGIAPNKMLAKVASDMNKPNGQFLVEPTKERILTFVRALPIRKVTGRMG